MEFITENWPALLAGFYALEKIVLLSASNWDDVVVSGFKKIILRK